MKFLPIILSILIFGFVFGACKSENSIIKLFHKDQKYQAHFSKPKYSPHLRAEFNNIPETNAFFTNESNSEKYPNLSVSESSEIKKDQIPPFKRNNIWTKKEYENYSENRYLIKSDDDLDKKDKKAKIAGILDIIAGIFGALAVISIFGTSGELFLGFGFGAIILALISMSLKPKKVKLASPREMQKEVEKDKTEALTEEERESLEIEKLGFFSSVSGFFAIFLTIMAVTGPYFIGTLALFIPFLAAASLLFGFISLKKYKNNPRKFRGKGFMYTGIGIGLLYSILTLLLVLLFFSFVIY